MSTAMAGMATSIRLDRNVEQERRNRIQADKSKRELEARLRKLKDEEKHHQREINKINGVHTTDGHEMLINWEAELNVTFDTFDAVDSLLWVRITDVLNAVAFDIKETCEKLSAKVLKSIDDYCRLDEYAFSIFDGATQTLPLKLCLPDSELQNDIAERAKPVLLKFCKECIKNEIRRRCAFGSF